jgi:hypothetical protein
MKKIYFLLLTVLVAATGWSKTTTWVGGANTNWDNPANWDNGVPAANDLVIFPTNTSATITRVAQSGDITLLGLSILGNSNIRFVNTVARTITIANGATFTDFGIDANAQLTLGTNINLTLASGSAGNPTAANINGDFIIETNRTYDSDNTNVITNVDGLIQNSGTITGTATRLAFAAGSTYIHARNAGALPLATWNASSTASIEGVINVAPTNLNQTFGNFTWNSPSQSVNYNFGGLLTTINGDFTVNSTGTGSIRLKNFGGATTNTNVAGDYVQTGGIVYIIGTSENQNLNIKGDFNMSGGTLTRGGTTGTAAVVFNGTTEQQFIKTGGSITNAINFTVNPNAKLNFGTSVLSGSTGTFTLSSTAKIITANDNGLGANGSVQITRVYNSLADYEFRGTNTGIFTTTGANTVRDLIINNALVDGEVMLDRPLTVTRTLNLTAGLITTTSNLLTIGAAGNATAPSATSFVNGPLAKVGNTAFTFPVGKAGEGYRTIGISAPSGNATFRAEFFRSNPGPGTLGAGITQISACEYWDLARTGGGAGISARVTLSWEANSPCGSSALYVTNPVTLRVAHLVGTTWVNEGRSASTGDNTSGTVTSQNAVNTFSPFTLASSSSLDNPLPVVFANEKATDKDGGVQIDFSNMTEKDVVNYTIEHSINGSDFSGISVLLPKSNQNDKADYSAFDANPAQGVNYYRVKAVETTGKITYSKILSVTLGTANKGITVYPNPVKGNQVTIRMSNIKRGQYTLRVINTAGQDVLRQTLNNQGSILTQTISLPATIKAGVYNMLITGGDYRETKTFIVQ